MRRSDGTPDLEPLWSAAAAAFAGGAGAPAAVVRARPVGGGSIHRACLVELADGRRLFVKTSSAATLDMFGREAEGLRALAAVGVIRVPDGAVAGRDDGGTAFLAMEAIDPGSRGAGFWPDFGRRFARLHQRGRGERFGWQHDSYIGATPQPNPPGDDWIAFWRDHRLGHQLRLARRAGLADPELERRGATLLDRLDTLLAAPDEPPTLLHGDLWSGNYLVDSVGAPVLVDPAVYYGHREADLAMTRLFGGFDDAFYAAYEEVWPLAPGWRQRLPIYQLYHLLNHLNLFGGGYRAGCLEILRRYG